MPCLAHEYHPRLPASNRCRSLSCLIREAYAHCHVPCVGRMHGAGWSSDDEDSDEDDALHTKQVVLNEMRNRQLKRKESRCSVESPTLSSTFVWSFTPLDPWTVLEKVFSPEKCVVAAVVEEDEKETASDDGHGDADDVQSEAFFSVKSFFTRSTSRAATVASSTDMDPPPATWEGFRDCEGWPFGLCRRPAVPPLPSTPADSWKWRKQNSGSNLAASPARAYSYKTTRSLPASPLAKKNLN